MTSGLIGLVLAIYVSISTVFFGIYRKNIITIIYSTSIPLMITIGIVLPSYVYKGGYGNDTISAIYFSLLSVVSVIVYLFVDAVLYAPRKTSWSRGTGS
jgi:hypothetical protein